MKEYLLSFMRMLSLTALMILISPVVIHAQAARTDFSGTWTLNPMESSPSARSSSGLNVTQEANLLTATTKTKDGMTSVSKYTLDGKKCINPSEEGDRIFTAKFSADGKTLTIFTRYTVGDMERTEQNVWSLRDSRSLSVVSTVSGTSGDEVTRYVYDKMGW